MKILHIFLLFILLTSTQSCSTASDKANNYKYEVFATALIGTAFGGMGAIAVGTNAIIGSAAGAGVGAILGSKND